MGCFKTWCLENFPFMEDDIKALDEYRLMCKLYSYIKNIIGDVSTLTEKYSTLETQFNELKEYVDTYLTDIDDVKQAIVLINEKIDSLFENVASNSTRIEEVNTNLTDLINLEVANLNQKIDNIQIGSIEVYDPTSGILSPLQTVINNLYNLTNVDGLTATEFDALDLTATAFDAYQITASDFDSKGKIILV